MRRKTDKSIPPTHENGMASGKCDKKIENAEIATDKRIMGGQHPQRGKQGSRRKGGGSTRASSDKDYLEHGKEYSPLLYWYCDPIQPIDR
jgi:hypothetical protein